MIVIIDYGTGNPGSIVNMLKNVGVEALISRDIGCIEEAEKLILPGVGAFDSGMRNLSDLGLIPILNHKVLEEKTPILGICLGMQLFANGSEEGSLDGLGWIDAECARFRFPGGQVRENRIPHMGWNTVNVIQRNLLFDNMYPEPRFYFAHSYHCVCKNENDILTTTCYGYDFVSSFMRDNIYGVQFHPEKSHKFGMRLLKNFAASL